jgi:hypothetical protein
VCFVAGSTPKGSYPKCAACGLPGHNIDQCHPLIHFCLDQALAARHPDIVARIKTAYKQFPRSTHSKTPRFASVKQLVSVLNLPPEDEAAVHSTHEYLDLDRITVLAPVDLQADHTSFAHSDTALVTYRDRPWFPSSTEHTAHTFQLVDAPLDDCIHFDDDPDTAHTVSLVQSDMALLVDSGSTITTVGSRSLLSEYKAPSSSGIAMRSATGHIVRPAGEGRIPFAINTGTGTLSVLCQHTPAIKSSIFLPAVTSNSLNYDSYTLSCDRRRSVSLVCFEKLGAPYITIRGTYVKRMPFISLPPESI